VRGGSWYWPAEHAHGGHRRRYEPDNDPPHHFGFRCAVAVLESP
jgi:formylglycine-generating enzyme required for sulfatase activity